MRCCLPAAAGMLAALAVMDVAIPQDAPSWAAWLALAAGAAAGELIRRLWQAPRRAFRA